MAIQRSKPYPSISVDEAVTKLEQIYRKLGDNKQYERNNFAQGMGYKDTKNGAFLRAVAALVQYGFVERQGESYTLTSIAKKILIPTSDNDRHDAVLEAALTPPLFENVYETYKGQDLPGLLPNILVTNFGILDGAKNKAVSVFRKTMAYVALLEGERLIDKDTVSIEQITPEPSSQDLEDDQLAPGQSATRHSLGQPIQPSANVPTTSFTKDFGEGRVAQLIIPTDISKDEREKLKTLLENM